MAIQDHLPERSKELSRLRVLAREIPFQERLSFKLLEQWAEEIPWYPENDPEHKEWIETPVLRLDLSEYGYGKVLVKDESVNPTGTIKDRPAWEITALYRDFARLIYMRYISGDLSRRDIEAMVVPRFSIITSGNEGRALADMFKRFGLPPVKLMVGAGASESQVGCFMDLEADVYLVDLDSQVLSAGDIRVLTNNVSGIDLTSVRAFYPEIVFYDWHVFEVLNEVPKNIFIPFGAGKLGSCYLYWQKNIVHGGIMGEVRDPRLKVHVDFRDVMRMNVMCAEPESYPSVADKLSAPFKPFRIFSDSDFDALTKLGFTGGKSGIYGVSEEYLARAFDVLRREGVSCEPSATAGLALYMQQYDEGMLDRIGTSLIVNTGKGMVE
jgi:threonine synthase